MKQSFYLSIVTICGVLTFACGGSPEQESAEVVTEETLQETSSITLSKVSSPEFPDSGMELVSPEESADLDAQVSFDYEIKNYQLGAQTLDADVKRCANSAKGQHIHLILNNQPYTAHYEPGFEMELDPGHYVALSFISRSYHESLKHYGAYNLRQFTVGSPGEYQEADLTAPHMFYSRPKGTYVGADTERILLDFYLVNTDLAPDGNKVKATINGEEFLLDQWAPMFIEGLPMGANTIKLELLDAQGNAVPGPFNTVERTIELEPASS